MARAEQSRWIRFWALFNGVLVASLVLGALFGERGVVRHERLSEELRRLEWLNSRLDQENQRLAIEVAAMREDDRYLETVIRDELGFVAADEMVLIFPPEAESPIQANALSELSAP